ncbi:MAG: 1-aminocyclopropane-carboxylate deaminase, partial [Thermoleophilaceae bacterium]|nr:1-aminocyclopropane-carboxylate deaminase [Thermoleophilaceae bacterium]
VIADDKPYGVASEATLDAIRLLARTDGLIADPVYEGRAVRGLIDLILAGRFTRGQHVLLMHLGGSPAVHAWSGRLAGPGLRPLPFA